MAKAEGLAEELFSHSAKAEYWPNMHTAHIQLPKPNFGRPLSHAVFN